MALPELLRHIYHNATDEVIRRGKKIFHTGGVQLVENDPLTERVIFRVRNDAYYNHYRVSIEQYGNSKSISMRCQCPYNMGTVCRHEAAALFQLNDLLQSGYFEGVKMEYDQSHTTVRMRQITTHFLKLFSSAEIYNHAANRVAADSVTIQEAKDDTVRATVKDENGAVFSVVLKQNDERYFDTSCPCGEKGHPLCVHKVTVFLQLYHTYGTHYFSTIRNWDAQKNKLLGLYGYSLKDDLKGKFEFAYHDGKPFLRVLDPAIKKIALQPSSPFQQEAQPGPVKEEDIRMGVVLLAKGLYFPHTTFQLISGRTNLKKNDFAGKIEKREVTQYIAPSGLNDRDRVLITALRKLGPEELFKSIRRDSPFGDFWDSLPKELKASPNAELRQQTWDFYLPRYQNLLKQFQDFPFIYFLQDGATLAHKNLQPLHFSEERFQTHISVFPEQDNFTLERQFLVADKIYAGKDVQVINSALVKIGEQLFAADTLEIISVMEEFDREGKKIISAGDWPEYLEQKLLSFSETTSITFDPGLIEEEPEQEPELRLYLRETEKLMVFKPIFAYGDIEKEWLDSSPVRKAKNGKIFIQKRDEAAEQTFLTMLRHLHPSMQESRKSVSFLLPANEALKGNWYFQFMDMLKEARVHIFGYEMLKQLKINPNKPKTKLQISSGIDWFDAEVEVSFGDEKVTIADIKKAMAKKERFVTLSDGSIGLLPEEWMEKYALMVKMGALNGKNNLRLKKFHFSALENAVEEINEEEILDQLSEKRERLMSFDFERPDRISIPENVHAALRPYQEAGFQWMSFLKDTGWGGILADDMGLGKTLQTLAFLQYYLNQNSGALFLVACPTTLIYNWENELNKFTPDIKYLIHHGPQRTSNTSLFGTVNLIITTYGTLRSDIKMLSGLQLDYVVLDESQAIKNPLSQIAKATLLLQSKNRLALSGTPVQNNTFDLFAQMNFLNPGMLGSMDFFRNEFANPIDKMQEPEAKENLRKLINPFLLRRTKEQVAPDLPEKIETVLYCEMGAHQRKIYDGYRNSFRTKILGEIESKGLERAQLSVLTGLMKLRQICDSPAILNDAEKFENHSVKINELVRELTENTGNHKALIFSQFLGMLALIREELERLNIPYVYFDGGTSSAEREKAIQRFQSEENCRVFLISLKAGGVGLNLTAADYVYIVDPWWNPAVEQQAIDRTHRIGQTKNIFAYRLICKDTIEEKILLLQERKLSLVKDLIADDNAFMKKLTKEDIAYLLS